MVNTISRTVQVITFSLLFLSFSFALYSQDVVVSAEIESKGVVGMPIKGSVTVTHDKEKKVDINSFRLGDDPLDVEFVKEVQISPGSPIVVSIYHFTLEPKTEGLHQLREISVSVGGEVYRSFSLTYEVESGVPAPTPRRTDKEIILNLENLIEGETVLYPGQRLKVGYRFSFNYGIDLTSESIPLLEAEGFTKVGGKDKKEYTKGGLNYLDVYQVIESVEPGEYTFPAGSIKGRAYIVDRLGQKTYAKSESYSETKPLTITVLPFPKEGQPPSFNGAIGESLNFSFTLLSSNEVTVGDKMELLIKISGIGELANMPMPEVCCQPGFSGFFRLSDLPPIEDLQGATKTFKVEMRPLNANIKQIPTLEFSYFNLKDHI